MLLDVRDLKTYFFTALDVSIQAQIVNLLDELQVANLRVRGYLGEA